MNPRNFGILASLAIIAGARAANADTPADSPWGVAVYGGDTVTEAGRLRSPLSSTIPDLGALNPQFSGTSGTLSLDKLRYDDLFRQDLATGVELSYTFSRNLQTYGRFDYATLDGRTRRAGFLSTDALGGSEPLDARFHDEDNKSLEIGSRYFWPTGTPWQPFAGIAIGATRLDAIRANFTTPDEAIDLANLRFTRSATVFSQSLETGVEFNPNTNFGVRFSVNADHMGAPPSARDPMLSELGYDASHDAEGRWTFPVAVAASFHFG
jgi:opacity protein-like surface antigen